jgi:hypothetical protein
VSALGDPPSGTGSFSAIATTTITTTVSGKLLVNAASPNATVTCSAVGACSQSYELFVDGSPVSKTTYAQTAVASASKTSAVIVHGLTGSVSAGAHTVELRTASGPNVASFTADGAQVQAVLVGG